MTASHQRVSSGIRKWHGIVISSMNTLKITQFTRKLCRMNLVTLRSPLSDWAGTWGQQLGLWKIVVHCSGLRVNTAVLWHVLGTAAISIRVCALLKNRVVFKVTTSGQANLSSSFTKCRPPSALQATTLHYKDSDAHWCIIFVKHVFWKHRLSKRNKT